MQNGRNSMKLTKWRKWRFFLFIYLFIYLFFLCNTFHSATSEEKKNVRVDGNFSILELLDISIVNKIKGMQENADIVESDLG